MTADRTTLGQVEPLRRQLGADEHVELAGREVVIHRLVAAAGSEDVRVEPARPQPRKARAQLRLDALRAGPEIPNPARAAARARVRWLGGPPAVVASQPATGEVKDVGQVAVRAANALAAIAAQDEGRGAATVDEEDGLLAPRPQRGERVREARTEDRPVAARQLLAQVDDLDARRAPDTPFDELTRSTIPPRARETVTTSGVAVPSTTRAPVSRARRRAAQRASRRGVRSDLYAPSCASSITMRRRSASGAMTADRVPTTTRASPRRMRHHASCRSPADMPECRVATASPTSAATRSTSCATPDSSGHEEDRGAAVGEHGVEGRKVDVGLARRGDAFEQELAAG